MGVSITAAPCLVRVILCACFFFLVLSLTYTEALDKDALRTLLLKLKGSASSSWDTNNSDPCAWRGVNCTVTNEDIQELHLSGLQLNGVIPAEIDTLQALSALDLSNNSLRGSIPPELGNCSSLLSVNLASNMLGGILPASLGKLPKLQVLDLSQNEITESIPAEFGNLTSLQELNLESNQLTGTIEVISRLAALTDLSLSRNNFTGSLPAGISTLFPILKNFSAYQNKLNGTIPSMEMSTLQSVNLASNSLTGIIPANMCTSQKLLVLTLDNNRLFGTIPEDLGSCNSLTTLRLGGNNFTGSIPNSIGKLENLVYFVADDNRLNGTIPSNISGWKSLSLLNLANNQLSGSIPSQLGEAVNLQELLLSNNKFTGAIPQELVKCKNLSKLHLSGNLLNGPLPSDICSSLFLEYLQLDGNALDGSLPPSIRKCERLLDLQLGHNNFSGSIPTEIGDLVDLIISLNLSSNEFTGTIPASLGKLTKLVLLDLSHNHLTGPIPKELGSMFSLLDWSFADNSLSGAVPMTGPIANSSASSFANNPNLCGGPLLPCEGSSSSSREMRNSDTFWKAAGMAMVCALAIVCALVVLLISYYWHSKSRLAEVDQEVQSLAEVRHFSAERLSESTQGYSKENLLGEGATSIVYRGVLSYGEVVAVKKFKDISSSREALLQEVNILSKLRHRNLVKVLGCVINLEVQAMVLEFMPTGNLQQYLYQDVNRDSQRRLSKQMILKVAQGVANALAYLHHEYDGAPIIHGDVKPSNILLDSELEAHLADFGLAKIAKSNRGYVSLTSNFKGSIGYMAPEFAYLSKITTKADVYSFGVVLLELMIGRGPTHELLHGASLHDWVKKKLVLSHDSINLRDIVNASLLQSSSIMGEKDESPFHHLLQMAVTCTEELPDKRPTMQRIKAFLESLTNY